MAFHELTAEETITLSQSLQRWARWLLARTWAVARFGSAVCTLELRTAPELDEGAWSFHGIYGCVARDNAGAELCYDLRQPLFRALVAARPGHDLILDILDEFAAGTEVTPSRVALARSFVDDCIAYNDLPEPSGPNEVYDFSVEPARCAPALYVLETTASSVAATVGI